MYVFEADILLCVAASLLPRRLVEDDCLPDLDEAQRGLIDALQPGQGTTEAFQRRSHEDSHRVLALVPNGQVTFSFTSDSNLAESLEKNK